VPSNAVPCGMSQVGNITLAFRSGDCGFVALIWSDAPGPIFLSTFGVQQLLLLSVVIEVLQELEGQRVVGRSDYSGFWQFLTPVSLWMWRRGRYNHDLKLKCTDCSDSEQISSLVRSVRGTAQCV